MTNSEILARLKKLAKKADPEPWRVFEFDGQIIIEDGKASSIGGFIHHRAKKNAELTVELRNLLPTIIELLEKNNDAV